MAMAMVELAGTAAAEEMARGATASVVEVGWDPATATWPCLAGALLEYYHRSQVGATIFFS